MATPKQKFYVVWRGREPGIYEDWESCKAQVSQFQQPQYKSFTTREEAETAFAEGYKATKRKQLTQTQYIAKSIAVDAACSGNPGEMEYRGVTLWNKQEIFRVKFDLATNNIGEFLAIVHALALLKQKNAADVTIYSDSQIAIGWIKQKKCRTKLDYTPRTAPIFDVIHRAEKWLTDNEFDTPIVKWPTEIWGEIPADFGRK